MSKDKVEFSFTQQIIVSIITSIILTSLLVKEIEDLKKNVCLKIPMKAPKCTLFFCPYAYDFRHPP